MLFRAANKILFAGYAVKWNTNSKHCEAAQSVVRVVLAHFLPEQLLQLAG
jgi:hypothetical protein